MILKIKKYFTQKRKLCNVDTVLASHHKVNTNHLNLLRTFFSAISWKFLGHFVSVMGTLVH